MRRKRLVLAAAIAVSLTPVWLRTPVSTGPVDTSGRLVAVDTGPATAGPFTLAGAWTIEGSAPMFGGFSALAMLPDGRLLAGTDGGRKLVFTRPDRAAQVVELSPFGPPTDVNKIGADLEALTTDPVTGTIWGAYESSNTIRRFDAELREDGAFRPSAMRDWGYNTGAESLARLADGRFLGIEESAREFRGRPHRALLFPSDPLSGDMPLEFEVLVPGDYRPVDAVALGDGVLLVLLRDLRFGLPPRFGTAIALIDLADVRAGDRNSLHIIAELGESFPHDNYEGMALSEDADGRHLWLISDDNLMSYQSTYLLKLRWNGERARQKARE